MNYFLLVKINIEKFERYYIELYKNFDLCFHPNLSDIIHVDGMICKIEKIDIDVSNDECFIYLNAIDNIPTCKSEEFVIPTLMAESNDLLEYGWEMFDYNFGENFKEEDLEKIEIAEEVSKRIGIENMRLIFIQARIRAIDDSNKENI